MTPDTATAPSTFTPQQLYDALLAAIAKLPAKSNAADAARFLADHVWRAR